MCVQAPGVTVNSCFTCALERGLLRAGASSCFVTASALGWLVLKHASAGTETSECRFRGGKLLGCATRTLGISFFPD